MLYGTKCWAIKNQQESKNSVAEMRMLRWISDHMRQNRIMNKIIRKKGMVESYLTWFGHVQRRPIEALVRRGHHIEDSPIIRSGGQDQE